MAITTEKSHASRAKDFLTKYRDGMYVCIAKSTPWPDDARPPEPDSATSDIEGPIGYMKVTEMFPVKPDPNGTINYRKEKYSRVDEELMVNQHAKWVYISAVIGYDELPLGQYRQIGAYSGLVPKSTVPSGKYNLLPSEVESVGTLEIIDNRQPSNRQADQSEKLTFIIEF